MGWPYQFVNLDDEQLKHRRQLLDNYGQFAQLSLLLLPLLYQLLLGIKLLASRLHQRSQYHPIKEQRSPVPFSRRTDSVSLSTWTWRCLNWWLNAPLAPSYETRKEVLLAIFWTLWLLYLITANTSTDYLHVTKRFGIVAASQLPIHYLLAAKAWSPIQYLTRMSHEELNPYHRLLGRVIVFLMACHASLYLNFFVQKGLLLKRVRDWDVILGLTAVSSAVVLFTTALARVRDANYRIFFYVHVAIASILLPVLWLHVRHLRLYVIESALVFLGIVAQRNWAQSTVQATVERVRDTNLLSITIPLPRAWRNKTFSPGQHIYLGFPSLPEKLRKNPFTIASSPMSSAAGNDGKELRLVVRALAGSTALLSSESYRPQPIILTIEGPYGSSTYFPALSSFDRVLLVAGGVGATFTLPLLAELEGCKDTQTRFVWSVKRRQDAAWALPSVVRGREDDGGSRERGRSKDVRVFVTSGRGEGCGEAEGEGMELRKLDGADGDMDGGERVIEKGRPDLREIVDETFEHDPNERVAVFVCGPGGMGHALRREVGRWVALGRDVFWHNEEFGW